MLNPTIQHKTELCFVLFYQVYRKIHNFHPRHFSLLSDETLDVMSQIIEISECLGEFPQCLDQVTVALIPKPAGGHRPIGIFNSTERVWAKARFAHHGGLGAAQPQRLPCM